MTKNSKKTNSHATWVAIGLMSFDYISIHLAYFLALWFRFDCCKVKDIPIAYVNGYLCSIIIYAIVAVVIFLPLRMYKGRWVDVVPARVLQFAIGSLVASALYGVIINLFVIQMPVSYHLVGAMIQVLLIVTVRYSCSIYHSIKEH